MLSESREAVWRASACEIGERLTAGYLKRRDLVCPSIILGGMRLEPCRKGHKMLRGNARIFSVLIQASRFASMQEKPRHNCESDLTCRTKASSPSRIAASRASSWLDSFLLHAIPMMQSTNPILRGSRQVQSKLVGGGGYGYALPLKSFEKQVEAVNVTSISPPGQGKRNALDLTLNCYRDQT